ncbi:integrin alpha-V-like [Gigantopelta aegis]|uniref:integrin alpha-V-like n=1 Tax=Gigantopelta aegis TaxID=1735272 RepID=UPI001B88A681|nr:integrin alpha-V-like [Gigantopelta aegis]
MIAAIGSWYWQGQLFNYQISDRKYTATHEGEPTEDDSYMGYSSAVGDFDGDGVEDYVVGIPKGEQHLGKVAVFNQNMSNLMNITGEQVGAYFGHTLAVTDLDGDQLDDIIIGAPLYSDFKSHMSYETGRVYIYYQTTQHTFKAQRKDILDGQGSKARFGLAITGLGDINKDGFNDLGVGAPYAGEDGRGAVYIYHGTRKGIITQVSQIIYAKQMDSSLSTFGYSLSGGQDQDGNTYPDILVGAYESDKAVFLRTRPVVRVTASLKIDPDMINLDTKSCTLIDDTRITCFTVYTCLEYSGIGVPEELFFDVNWELDVLQRNRTREEQRAYYLPTEDVLTEANTIKLTRKATWCTSSFAYIKNDLRDKLTPIAVDFKFKLKSDEKKKRRRRRNLVPILDQYIPTNVQTEAQILKHCGRDNICIPDLVLNSFRISAAHIIGDRTELEILIMIENRGEDAYNTQLWINLPPGVSYKNADAIQAVQEAPVSCRAFFTKEAMVLCDLGNPLPSRAKTNFTLRVAPKDVNGTKDDLEFALHVNSSNPEILKTTINNFAAVTIPVTATAKININGKTDPEQININTTKAKANRILKRVVEHVYELRNYGKSATETTALEIYWPSHDSDYNPIFPIIGQPLITEGVGTCKTVFVTPDNNTGFQYGPYSDNSVDVILQNQRLKRAAERNVQHRLVCSDWCTVIQCLVGYMKANDNFLIKIRAELNVPIFLQKEIDQMHLTSQAYARVLSMPYKLKNIDPNAFDYDTQQVTTEVTADRPDSGSRPIEIWIIAISVSAGLLVLLLIVILLWWCGFFKRWQPEDEGYMIANGGTSKMDVDNKMWE